MDDSPFAKLSPEMQKLFTQYCIDLAAMREMEADIQRIIANSRKLLDESFDLLQQLSHHDEG